MFDVCLIEPPALFAVFVDHYRFGDMSAHNTWKTMQLWVIFVIFTAVSAVLRRLWSPAAAGNQLPECLLLIYLYR